MKEHVKREKNPKPYVCESNSEIKNKMRELKSFNDLSKDNSEMSYYAKQIQDVKRDFSKDYKQCSNANI